MLNITNIWLTWYMIEKRILIHSLSGLNFAIWTDQELIRELLFQNFNSLNRFFVLTLKDRYRHILMDSFSQINDIHKSKSGVRNVY